MIEDTLKGCTEGVGPVPVDNIPFVFLQSPLHALDLIP
jgi:hypothetical protein